MTVYLITIISYVHVHIYVYIHVHVLVDMGWIRRVALKKVPVVYVYMCV